MIYINFGRILGGVAAGAMVSILLLLVIEAFVMGGIGCEIRCAEDTKEEIVRQIHTKTLGTLFTSSGALCLDKGSTITSEDLVYSSAAIEVSFACIGKCDGLAVQQSKIEAMEDARFMASVECSSGAEKICTVEIREWS